MKKTLYITTIAGLFMLLFIVTGCEALTGKEIARIPVNELSIDTNFVMKETSVDLKKGDKISFWSDMDVEYEGDLQLRFQIEIWTNGHILEVLEIDPFQKNITLNETQISLGDKTTWAFSGKNSEKIIENDGNYIFKAILISNGNPTLKLNKAEIIIKK